eukprot:7376787-Prymnesium_polylepis.3
MNPETAGGAREDRLCTTSCPDQAGAHSLGTARTTQTLNLQAEIQQDSRSSHPRVELYFPGTWRCLRF